VKANANALYPQIEANWVDEETASKAKNFVTKFFPGRVIVPGRIRYYRLTQSTLLSVRYVDDAATDFEFYSRVLSDLMTDSSAVFRRIIDFGMYWVDFIDLQPETPSRWDLFGEFLKSGGGLLTIVPFGTGIITAYLPSGPVAGVIVGTIGSAIVLVIGGFLAYLGHGRITLR
jgi:hypothetical protein